MERDQYEDGYIQLFIDKFIKINIILKPYGNKVEKKLFETTRFSLCMVRHIGIKLIMRKPYLVSISPSYVINMQKLLIKRYFWEEHNFK